MACCSVVLDASYLDVHNAGRKESHCKGMREIQNQFCSDHLSYYFTDNLVGTKRIET